MARINWDWPAQLENCNKMITELQAGIAAQEQKIRALRKAGMKVEFAQRLLAIRQDSWARVCAYKRLIETRIADAAAERHATDLSRLLSKLQRSNGAPT